MAPLSPTNISSTPPLSPTKPPSSNDSLAHSDFSRKEDNYNILSDRISNNFSEKSHVSNLSLKKKRRIIRFDDNSFGINNSAKNNRSKSSKINMHEYDQDLIQNNSYYGCTRRLENNSTIEIENDISLRHQYIPTNNFYYGSVISTGSSESSLTTIQTHKNSHRKESFFGSVKQAIGKKMSKHNHLEISNEKLSRRVNRFSGLGGIASISSAGFLGLASDVDRYMGKSIIGGGRSSNKINFNNDDYSKMIMKGTCEILEKRFLRLTAPPRAELVRPQGVMKEHLRNLNSKLSQNQYISDTCIGN